ncbi:tetratricopeptide repeat protein [Qipengyuania sp.]|uniref:tetratricopeptide repeat protein n=1 Tax=Qipengyuania sp. TaxID=2004515 RepID=UPI0035C868DA
MSSPLGVSAATALALAASAPLAAQPIHNPLPTAAGVQLNAQTGDPVAIATLGWLYESGHGVTADAARAAGYYRAAAGEGDAFAKWRLGVMIDRNLTEGTASEAIQLFREAAADRTSGAAASLGVMYAAGRGVDQDFEAAMRYYQAAAHMGNAHGLEGIGILYANGQGVKRDMREALAHWLVAAAAGNGDAKSLLGQYMPSASSPEAAPVFARANQIADAYDRIVMAGVRTASMGR